MRWIRKRLRFSRSVSCALMPPIKYSLILGLDTRCASVWCKSDTIWRSDWDCVACGTPPGVGSPSRRRRKTSLARQVRADYPATGLTMWYPLCPSFSSDSSSPFIRQFLHFDSPQSIWTMTNDYPTLTISLNYLPCLPTDLATLGFAFAMLSNPAPYIIVLLC